MEGITGTVPELRKGIVTRARLIERIRAQHDCPVIALVAGAGFGKTTLLVEAAHADPRAVAWVPLSASDGDPAMLLGNVAAALAQIEPISAREQAQLTATSVDFNGVQIPRLRRLLEGRTQPFVLVLDDIHRLPTEEAVAAVEVLCESVPEGSQVMLATRDGGAIRLGAMRARRGTYVIDGSDLVMDVEEAADLLRRTGLELAASTCELLVERTEGWPVGLYLAAIALRGNPDPDLAAQRFAGDDRVVVEYLRDEFFEQLSNETIEFLIATSILDVLSGPVCDAVLEVVGSAKILEDLERSNMLVMSLDRTRERFRYHALLRDELRARVHRHDRELERLLHARASAWYEANGSYSEAVSHAAAAGDEERFDKLVWLAGPTFIGSGLTATVDAWLDLVSPQDVARRPALTIAAAWSAMTSRNMNRLTYWFGIAERMTDERPLPDGMPFHGAVALLRALIGAEGLEAMRSDARSAYEMHPRSSAFRPVACLLEGVALRLSGHAEAAKPRLLEGADVGKLLSPATQSQCVAQLAAIAAEEGDWEDAQRLADEAVAITDSFNLDDRGAQAEVFAIAAFVHAHNGASVDARKELKQSLWLLSMYSTIAPWLAAESRVMLARAALLLGDVETAGMLVREAGELAAAVPDAAPLQERVARLQEITDRDAAPIGVTASPLTPAEMRVLRYLPTHLTFVAIANELFVSRNTVKTQAISIYRKLGVSSRTPAVETARGLGLLEV